LIAVAVVAAAAGCGTQGIQVPASDPNHEGAQIFSERCSGCHTLTPAGTEGSSNRSERQQGPNLDQRNETMADVIYAIRNGGFSGAIMPQNIVVGPQAVAVAKFIVKYSGRKTPNVSAPGSSVCASGASTAGGGAAGTTPSGP
jgi:mono/diheme cytochrome c family protein